MGFELLSTLLYHFFQNHGDFERSHRLYGIFEALIAIVSPEVGFEPHLKDIKEFKEIGSWKVTPCFLTMLIQCPNLKF
jgi:hypothetical protein